MESLDLVELLFSILDVLEFIVFLVAAKQVEGLGLREDFDFGGLDEGAFYESGFS